MKKGEIINKIKTLTEKDGMLDSMVSDITDKIDDSSDIEDAGFNAYHCASGYRARIVSILDDIVDLLISE